MPLFREVEGFSKETLRYDKCWSNGVQTEGDGLLQ